MKVFSIFCMISFGAMGIITGCNSENPTKTKTTVEVTDTEPESVDMPDSQDSQTGVATQTAIDLAGLRNADSVQVLFFTDPYGKDSLRYTRFFKHYNTSDTATTKPILRNLDQLFSFRTEVMNCRSEGKLYFFKAGQEMKTVYFSTGKKSTDCAFLYFIKDGGFYYVQIHAEVANLLNKIKPLAKKPVANVN